MPALTGIALGLVFGVSRIGPGQLRPGRIMMSGRSITALSRGRPVRLI